MRWVPIAAILLGGCAATASGNSLGGVFSSVGMDPALAQKTADAHCAKYSKRARITNYEQKASGNVLFECK